MSDQAAGSIRRSIIGADRAIQFEVIDGGRRGGGDGSAGQEDDECPVRALGHADGRYVFLDFAGQPRMIGGRDLGNRNIVLGLFGGRDDWLRNKFPKKVAVKDDKGHTLKDEDGNALLKTVDFSVNGVAQDLIARASRAGLWGSSVAFRQPGIWRGEDGLPVVHCGDAVMINDCWREPGFRTGNQIWVAAERMARPAAPCSPAIARELQDRMQRYWNYRQPAAAITLLGQAYSGWLCGALGWRLNAFVTGPSGSGKSAMRRLYRALMPAHRYSSDTTKSGIEQAISGVAVPAIIEEAADRAGDAGRQLLDMVLAASDDEGTKLTRGTADGKGRVADVLTAVVMFSIYPPPMQPQHVGRFVLIELERPHEGVDYRAEHDETVKFAQKHAAGLWGRAICALERYNECLMAFRAALGQRGCSPREMDSKGALLAGWYVMTNDGLPDERAVLEGINALDSLIVTAHQAESDDAPARALRHLLSSHLQLHRSTDREPIGDLIEVAFFGSDSDVDSLRQPAAAQDVLARNGIRAVLPCLRQKPPPDGSPCKCPNCWGRTGKPIPRPGSGGGIWVATQHPTLDGLFRDSEWAGGKWLTALARCRDAIRPGKNIRIGSVPRPAIWLPASLILPQDDSDDG